MWLLDVVRGNRKTSSNIKNDANIVIVNTDASHVNLRFFWVSQIRNSLGFNVVSVKAR
jgi:hypothetical protein